MRRKSLRENEPFIECEFAPIENSRPDLLKKNWVHSRRESQLVSNCDSRLECTQHVEHVWKRMTTPQKKYLRLYGVLVAYNACRTYTD